MGLFTIFGTSLRGLNAYSGAMGVAANNISNSSNENYSRQRIEFSTLPPDVVGGLETGRGVELSSITQVVNSVLEQRLNNIHQETNQHNARLSYLTNIENVFNEVAGGGLNDAISGFFNSWMAAASDPSDTTARQNVLNTAESLIDRFHSYGDSLVQSRQAIDSEIKNSIPIINDKLQTIADLNQKIQDSGSGALSLKDLRRQALNELGALIDINYIENGDDLQVYLKSGIPLVSGPTVATLSTQINVDNSDLNDVYYSLGGTSANITNSIQDGRLKGLIEARDTDLVAYQEKLDDLAYTLSGQINALHVTGYNLDGATTKKFFTTLADSDDAARSLSLSVDVDGNPDALAFSAAADEIPGGNDIATSIAELYDTSSITFDDGSTNSFAGFYGDLLAEIGNDTAIAQSNADFSQSVLDQINLERLEESGVNVDEEQANLIRYQSAYQACGQLIKIADEILQTLLGALG